MVRARSTSKAKATSSAKAPSSKAASKSRAAPSSKAASSAKAASAPKAISEPSAGKIVASLQALATTLGYHAAIAASNSGDDEEYARQGLEVETLHAGYWLDEYRFQFFSAFYALSPELRREPRVRQAASSAQEHFLGAMRDEAGWFRYLKALPPAARRSSLERTRLLRFFDGASERPVEVAPFEELRQRLERERPRL